MYEEMDPAFDTINKISDAQRTFFEDTVKQMQARPYHKWTSLWVEPPDPTLTSTPFGKGRVGSSSAWELMPMCFYSPAQLPMWRRAGFQMPCPRHGWAHSQYVKTQSEWRARLVKGVIDDFVLAGQVCCCSECRREHDRLVKRQHAAEKAGAAAGEIEARKAEAQAATSRFMSYDPRLIHYLFERFPWAAQKLPAFLTHKGALSTEVLWLLTNSCNGVAAESRSMEGLLKQLRALRTSSNQLSFYSFQRDWRRQPSVMGGQQSLAQLSTGLSSVSEHYLREVLQEFYFSGMERYVAALALARPCSRSQPSLTLATLSLRYVKQWFEQHCLLDTCVQSDHHCKMTSRTQHQGERVLPNVYKAMNSWGGIAISVAVETTSYNDPTLIRAHDAERAARERRWLPAPTYAVLDNPHKDRAVR